MSASSDRPRHYITAAELRKKDCVYCGKSLSEAVGGEIRITFLGGKPAHLACLPPSQRNFGGKKGGDDGKG